MRKRETGIAAALIAMAAAAGAQTADELIARNIQARGGLEKIKSIQSLRMIGTLELGDDRMPTVLELKRPNRMRWEFTLDGQTAVQAYDGTEGWAIMPFSGRSDPEPMPPEDLEDARLQADIDGPLVDAKAKGNRVELVGREKAGDRDAWKLRITLGNGEECLLFLDAKTYLQILTITERKVEGNRIQIESTIGDYRAVDGVLLPHSFEAASKGMPQKQALRFEKIEVNVPLDDSRFHMPKEGKPAAPREPAPTPVESATGGQTR